jgi:hypothetical protein
VGHEGSWIEFDWACARELRDFEICRLMDQLGFEIDWLDFEGTVVNIPSLCMVKCRIARRRLRSKADVGLLCRCR